MYYHAVSFINSKTIENYSQEIGRSGRDGESSFCEVFANRDNINVLENFVYGDTPEKNGIRGLVELIKNNESALLELKPISLSKELDIRFLPFKTLLVYLDIYGIIKPKYTFFDEYSFKYKISANQIVNTFQGERRDFVSCLLNCCDTKKTWVYLNMSKMLGQYNTDRKRVISALDYFDTKGWIELQAKQAVEVYQILNNGFDPDATTEKIHALFAEKETREIKRIHNMIGFFETNSCLSHKLAGYFGENIEKELCGHCSFCTNGITHPCSKAELDPINKYNANEIITKIKEKTGEISLHNIAKLLCGIQTPAFSRLGVKKIPEFGMLAQYPFKEIKEFLHLQ